MGTFKYKDFFNTPRWIERVDKICMNAKFESCSVTGIPSSGKRLFLKCIEENYSVITGDKDSLIISIEFLPGELTVEDINKKLLMEFKEKIDNELLKAISDTKIFLEQLIAKEKKVLIIINKFERLVSDINALEYIESLRAINPFNIRFIAGCDISCLTKPEIYKNRSNLVLTNLIVLKPFTYEEAIKQFALYEEMFGWKNLMQFEKEIYETSGGVPGFLKQIAKYVDEVKPTKLNVQDLLKDPVIELKVKQIYDKLSANDLIINNEFNLNYKDVLLNLGIINNSGKTQIKVLEGLMNKDNTESSKTNLKKELSAQEYKLYIIFEENIDELISLQDVASRLWGSLTDIEYSMWATYKLISNLNKKLKAKGMMIKNFRGRGYMMMERKD